MQDVSTYRFTISFRGTSEANVRVGELLQSLGHKKSEVIVCALNEYLNKKPELMFAGAAKDSKESMNINMLERLIENMVVKKLEGYLSSSGQTANGGGMRREIPESDIPVVAEGIAQEVSAGAKMMLDNLGSFFEDGE